MTTPTQNDIPSSTAIDVRFNAEKLDEVINSDNETYDDRFGNPRFTLKGIVTTIQNLIGKFGTADAFSQIEGSRKLIKDSMTFMERMANGLPISILEYTAYIDKKNSTEPNDWDWTEAFKKLRDDIQTWQAWPVSGKTAYRSLAVHLPGFQYNVAEEIYITDLRTASASAEKTNITFFGDGINNTVIKLTADNGSLFRFDDIKVNFSDMSFIGNTTTQSLIYLGDISGNKPLSNSSFRRLLFRGSHKNIVIAHAFDVLFEQIDVVSVPGGTVNDESTAFEVLPVQLDNSNNLMFKKIHFELCYGSYITLFRTTKPLVSGSYHHTFIFDDLHIESRRYDVQNMYLNGLITSEFGGIHIIRSNSQGGDITYANARHAITIESSYHLCFHDGLVSHSGTSYPDMLPLLRHVGNVGSIVYERVRFVPCNTGVNSLAAYIKNDSNDTNLLSTAFINCILNNFDTTMLFTSLWKISSTAAQNRSHFFYVDPDGNFVQAYTGVSNGLTKTDGLRIGPGGDISPKARAVPSVITLNAGASTTYQLSNANGKNNNRRGLVTMISKSNLTTGTCMFTTNGSSLMENMNGGLYKIASASASVANFVNISLSGGNLLIENLTSNQVLLGVDFLGFMD